MIRWTTPTFVISPRNVPSLDFTQAESMYFTITTNSIKITKTGKDLSIEPQLVKVYMSQEDTGKLKEGEAEIQLNWMYTDALTGRRLRAATKPRKICIDKNLLGEEIE